MKKWKFVTKKLFTAFLAFCMAIPTVSMPVQAEEASSGDEKMLVHYDFEELSGAVADGTTIKDVSGNGNDATAKGNNLTAADGALTLPGGAYGSGAGYVELPQIFDDATDLTVSIWMKNETGANNYAGFYIGTPAAANGSPTNYFILCNTNPAGVYKAAITNSVNVDQPWTTEVGTGASGNSDGFVSGNQWALYTMVLTENSLSVYLNGEKYKTYATSRSIADLGDGLVSYIGMSPYPDMFYRGGVSDLQIYSAALTDEEVKALYLNDMSDDEILQVAQDEVVIPEVSDGAVSCNFVSELTLVDSVMDGKVAVAWASSEPEVITNDGKIIEPASETSVMMVATLTYGEATLEKVININVEPSGDTEYSMTVDVTNEGVEINDNLIGLFFEDINSAADGGLFPEEVKNNSFENYFNVITSNEALAAQHGNEYTWKLHWVSSNDAAFRVVRGTSDAEYLNENNRNYAVLTGDQTLLNGGFAPMSNPNSAAIGITEGEKYDFTIWTKAAADYTGTLKVQVVNESGSPISNEVTVEVNKDGTWKKSDTLVLTGTKTQKGKIKLTIEGAGDGVLNIDMVSLASQDTYGYGNKNYAYGMGVRKDLVEKLIALEPNFIRFPGGCIIEGNSGRDSYYNWERTIGPLEEREAIGNQWASSNGQNGGVGTNTYGYMQSYGFGYHEIIQLCEDMGAEPFPILSAGVFCQFANEQENRPAASGEELDKFAQHATHLIDYCWGDPNSDNAVQAEWASKRVANGHEEPFNLNYVGIGNENWSDKYLNNFKYIKEYVEAYVAENYPGRTITIISSSGPAAEDANYQYAWKWLNQNVAGETLVDEHYYQSPEFMLNTDDRYDYYNRLEDGGSDVFLGEYATHVGYNRNNILESAICDAAYMTGIERNADIVRFASYAPLFEKEGSRNWDTNLIHFNEYESMATPNYYVQQMFSTNIGTQVVNTILEKEGADYENNTGSPIIGTWLTSGYITNVKVTREDGTVLLDEKFDGTSGANWQSFPGTTGTFSITEGKLSFSAGSGMNCVWLPDVVNDPEWRNYKVEVTAVKTGGEEGFLIGAGAKDADDYIWYNIGGWGNTQTVVERSRTGKGKWIIGNEMNADYQAVNTNEEMYVTFNYGADDKIQAYYTTAGGVEVNTMNGNLRAYQNDIYQVASKDDEYVYLKLVNHDNYAKAITLNYPGIDATEAEVTCLTGEAGEYNNIGAETLVPVTTTVAITDGQMKYQIPGMSFTVIKVAINEVTPEPLPYTDVTEADWFYDSVAYTYYEGLMTGMDPTTFGPYGNLSRAQFALILHRMEGEVVVETEKSFKDINGDEWYGPAVLWAAENGIVTGYQNGNFGPADLITREQMALMMYRYAKYLGEDVSTTADISSFADAAAVSEFALDAIKWANGMGIITGKDNGTKLDPQGNTARAEAAAIIQRFMQ